MGTVTKLTNRHTVASCNADAILESIKRFTDTINSIDKLNIEYLKKYPQVGIAFKELARSAIHMRIMLGGEPKFPELK